MFLVAVVPAVIGTVTLHPVGDTSAIATGELLAECAALAERRNQRTFDFVTANGFPRNAGAVAALHFSFGVTKERFRWAQEVLFVAVVAAVVQTITNVFERNASKVLTLKRLLMEAWKSQKNFSTVFFFKFFDGMTKKRGFNVINAIVWGVAEPAERDAVALWTDDFVVFAQFSVAFQSPFVAEVSAVIKEIAQEVQRDAVAVLTSELSRATTWIGLKWKNWGTNKRKGWKKENVGEFVVVDLIRVSEIALSCTTPELENVQKLVQLQNPQLPWIQNWSSATKRNFGYPGTTNSAISDSAKTKPEVPWTSLSNWLFWLSFSHCRVKNCQGTNCLLNFTANQLQWKATRNSCGVIWVSE